MIYLDHAATTTMYPEAVKQMLPYFQRYFCNPSGTYQQGTMIHKSINQIRANIAQSIHVEPEEVYFTSGGTESDNWILINTARNYSEKGRHIITTQIEHHAILHTCQFLETQGYEVTYLPVNEKGIVEPEMVREAIRPDTILVSIMFANNEIGTVQPIAQIGQITREKGVVFHTDAVQAYGHLPINAKELGIQSLSASAHKFGGPKGTGFLYVKKDVKLSPLINGGAQERKERAGTENVPGIMGMGKAAELSIENMSQHEKKESMLRDYLKDRILSEIEMVRLNGDARKRLPGNLNVSFRGLQSQALITMLEMRGIYVSGGSACTSEEKGPSHVLKALGLSDEMAGGALRITIGYENTMEEMDYTFRCIQAAVEELRKL